MAGADPEQAQNWESGIDLTVLRCTFFRNFCGGSGITSAAALGVFDAWPFAGKVDQTDFVRWRCFLDGDWRPSR